MKCVINLFDDPELKYEAWEHGTQYGGKEAPIAKLWGAEKLGFHAEILSPGKFGCPYHRHQKEEELFIALRGSATVRHDGEFYVVSKGDLFFFKAGNTHQLYNHTKEDFLFFALSSEDPEEVCEYPDSAKKFDTRKKEITQQGVKVDDYWKDEENPKKFWPKEIVGEN